MKRESQAIYDMAKIEKLENELLFIKKEFQLWIEKKRNFTNGEEEEEEDEMLPLPPR